MNIVAWETEVVLLCQYKTQLVNFLPQNHFLLAKNFHDVEMTTDI